MTEPTQDDTATSTPAPEPYVPPPIDEDPSATGVEVGDGDDEGGLADELEIPEPK